MATAAKFRIDVAIHDLLVNSSQRPPAPAQAKGFTLPEPVFPQFPERLDDPGPPDLASTAFSSPGVNSVPNAFSLSPPRETATPIRDSRTSGSYSVTCGSCQ